jgi:hypothetical protein
MFRIILPRFIFRVERWKWNKEYRVYVSNMGHFMDEHKKIIPVKINQGGYVAIKTPYGRELGHRLVMKTWRPTAAMDKLTVDHLDHNKRNNSVENLEWVTRAENLERARADYINENVKAKPKVKAKTVKVVKSGAEAAEAVNVITALKLNPKKVFAMEEFYPVVNGIAFDDCQTAWWYCQEILSGCHKSQCTCAGLEDRFQRLLKIYNGHHWEYIGGKKKYQYCTMTLSFALKGENS